MYQFIITTKEKKIKGWTTFRKNAEWTITQDFIKKKKQAIWYFLGEYSWFTKKDIKSIKKIKI